MHIQTVGFAEFRDYEHTWKQVILKDTVFGSQTFLYFHTSNWRCRDKSIVCVCVCVCVCVTIRMQL